MEKKAKRTADWEGLHEDILILILKKIELIDDFVYFGTVCKSWNEAACNNKHCLRPQIPWLMGGRDIYTLSKGKIVRNNLYFPWDGKCIGLDYGWTLTISRLGDMNLVHRISRSEIKLPSQTSIETYNTYWRWPCYTFTTRAAISGNPSESSNFTVMIAHTAGDYLGYWRPGATCWTSKYDAGRGFYDLIPYKGQFYAISYNGTIWACVIQKSSVVLRQIAKLDLSQLFEPYMIVYIVESASPDVLTLVVRKQTFVEEIPHSSPSSYEDIHLKYGLKDFEVYELDLINVCHSKKIMNLGDRAIFVGNNTSLSFDASQFIGIKSNHIYYTDPYEGFYPNLISGDGTNMGCYSLEDGKISRFNVGEARSRISPPFWFIPSL